MKKNIIVLLLVLGSLLLGSGIYFNTKTKNDSLEAKKENKDNIYVVEVYKNLTFSGFSVEKKGDVYSFNIEILNRDKTKKSDEFDVSIDLMNDKNAVITTIKGKILSIQPNSKTTVTFNTDKDIMSTDTYKIKHDN